MLKPKRIKNKGYARLETNLGELTMELHTDTAPKAVWNFVKLAQKGYYKDVAFHRNIPNFMIQGGDPTGTGRGGASIWGKYFDDEFDGPQTHNARGTVSMANKGKNTNSSQFFLAYKAVPHLDRKHTIFGKIISGLDVLAKMEDVPTDGSNRPLHKIAQHQQQERDEAHRREVERQGGEDADRTTWTGKRIRADGSVAAADGKDSVGKYLKAAAAPNAEEDVAEEWTGPEPARKKMRGMGGFGNFDGW
ncbi:hypothetical protein NLG97_g8641 [Lecanicillium saksenae]|uniref:Uncharacterized protein n=1 Tax=Lecanicillium saksenae TaxID=468837 RepID=A0ACC1QKZ4_9HYPO|nr:hypothetical protein NLG97_g8641 [Lecanicillium saksenae]